jgi:hypothetical protein
MTIHVFTHSAGFIESLSLPELQVNVAQIGLLGEYSTRAQQAPEPEPPAPITVSTYQAKAALAIVGRYDDVDEFMQLDTTDRITKLKWEYSNFSRTDPSVLAIAAALRMSEAELDGLFALAATIE